MKSKILTARLSALLTITASAQYKRTDLASNQPGVAPTTDFSMLLDRPQRTE